jgi:hypothetical protein
MASLSPRPSGRVSYELLRARRDGELPAGKSTSAPGGRHSESTFSQSANRLQDFTLSLSTTVRMVTVYWPGAGSYPNGAAYVNGQPQEAQLAFRLFHDPARAAIGLVELFSQWLFLGAVASAALILPGLALLLALPVAVRGEASRLDLMFLAPALSVAIYPLLIVFTGLAGIRAGPIPGGLSWRAGLRSQSDSGGGAGILAPCGSPRIAPSISRSRSSVVGLLAPLGNSRP